MRIEIHMLQNHSPANLNRDDLGAPKTCYFGGVMRSRISSQCLKRSIRMSKEFESLRGGIRTRQLARLIEQQVTGKADVKSILEKCGIKSKSNKEGRSDMLVFTTREAIAQMAKLLQNDDNMPDEMLANIFGKLIAEKVCSPDMALCGRMLETGVLKDTTVEASLQVAHAISTHTARPEVDYYVAADDIPGDDAGAGFVDEALYASACFYKYFSIDWEQLVTNLKGNDKLAAHTVGAFLRAAATVSPTGKQNSFASHTRPDGILIELRDSPVSYANAFADPVKPGTRGLVGQSVAQLAQHIHDLDEGYGRPTVRFWFSPGKSFPLGHVEMAGSVNSTEDESKEVAVNMTKNFGNLDELLNAVITWMGHNWDEVRQVVPEAMV